MSFNQFLTLLILFSVHLTMNSVSAQSVDSSDGGKPWQNRKTKTVRPARTPDARNLYGGMDDTKVARNGFFRVIEKNNKWWLVDPEGCLFISMGVNSVEPDRVSAETTTEQWSQTTHQLLTNAGFNTIGRWSAPEPFAKIDKKIPWCSSHRFMKNYSNIRPAKRGKGGYPNETLPVFDPEWPEFCEKHAKAKLSKTVEDRYLLGHFSDNELPFRPDALTKYLALPEKDYGHQAALNWMKENNISNPKSSKAQEKFLELVSRLYFETVNTAIKAVDPNHLYIGSRLHGKCINEPVLRGANACDVVSINYYHAWQPDVGKTDNWTKWSERPFLVGEFYAMKVASKKTDADGAGFRVRYHKEAGRFYHTYTLKLIKEAPNCIGWHWFKYADDVDDYQKGVVSTTGEPHRTLLEAMKVLNDQVYALRGQ